MRQLVAAIVLCSSPAYATGWSGPIEERKPQRLPGFSNSYQGRVSFVKWLVPIVKRHGLSEKAALLYTAHVARETTYGYNVWDFNFGNTKTGHVIRGPWFWLVDSRGERDRYRAFDTAEEGIEDNLRLLREGAGGLYRKAWQQLANEDHAWYGAIGLAGYYAGPKGSARHTPETIAAVQKDYNGTADYVHSCWSKPVESASISAAIVPMAPARAEPWSYGRLLILAGILLCVRDFLDRRGTGTAHTHD